MKRKEKALNGKWKIHSSRVYFTNKWSFYLLHKIFQGKKESEYGELIERDPRWVSPLMFHTSNSIRTSGTICWKTNPDIGMMKRQSIPDKNPQYFARAVTGHKNLKKKKEKRKNNNSLYRYVLLPHRRCIIHFLTICRNLILHLTQIPKTKNLKL